MDAILFWVLAAAAVTASVLVVGQRNPMYSVLLLILSFGALSGLYTMLGAPFVAVIQIIIYAGAIMVLFLFVVMLLNAQEEETAHGQAGAHGRRRRAAALWRGAGRGAGAAIVLGAANAERGGEDAVEQRAFDHGEGDRRQVVP
jgi:NADH:ubiquinone oxidoreductase subunit 6 (subunit J)